MERCPFCSYPYSAVVWDGRSFSSCTWKKPSTTRAPLQQQLIMVLKEPFKEFPDSTTHSICASLKGAGFAWTRKLEQQWQRIRELCGFRWGKSISPFLYICRSEPASVSSCHSDLVFLLIELLIESYILRSCVLLIELFSSLRVWMFYPS